VYSIPAPVAPIGFKTRPLDGSSVRAAIGLYVVLLLGDSWIAGGQEFEVASVKPAPTAEGSEGRIRAQDMMWDMMAGRGVPVNGGRVSLKDATLAQLVAMAHKVKPGDVTGPGWITELRYYVEAKLPESAQAKDAPEMLRRLLEERFGLKTHTDTKTTNGYALVVAKDGPKLKPAVEPTAPLDREEIPRQLLEQSRKRVEELSKAGPMRGYRSWGSNQTTMAGVAENVGRMIQAPVTDETGLPGKYDVRVELFPGESRDETVEHRMALALAKLGLKLDSRKTTVTLLVVDAASKTPTEN
jgi:uncharacterized protein (TIGR03435 family)